MKTPEENLKISLEILERNNPFKSDSGGAVYFTSHILDAMQEYGDLRHNAAVEMCAKSAELDMGDRGTSKQYIATDDMLNEFGITVSEQSILKNKI